MNEPTAPPPPPAPTFDEDDLTAPPEGQAVPFAAAGGGDGRRRRTPEHIWRLLIEQFRNNPDHVMAARMVGCDPRTAKKAFERGLPYPWTDGRSIKQILDDEQLGAPVPTSGPVAGPAVIPGEELARRTALAQRADEVRILRVAKSNALGMLVTSARLVQATQDLGQEIRRKLKLGSGLPVDKAVRAVRDIAAMNRQIVESARAVIEMERELLGDMPKGTQLPEMTQEEALRELKEAEQIMTRARERAARSGLRVVGGTESRAPSSDDEDDGL